MPLVQSPSLIVSLCSADLSGDSSLGLIPNHINVRRYVQIPSSVDIKQALHSFTDGMGRGRGRGRGRGGGEVSKGRLKIMSEREQRRQEDIRNALKMREEWKKDKAEKQDLD